jgi:hypothetical protein
MTQQPQTAADPHSVGKVVTLHRAPPLTLDQVETSAEHYGVRLAAIGDHGDGDTEWVAFTHDARRALAALHRELRTDPSQLPFTGITVGKPAWWQVVNNCGCGDTCPHSVDKNGDRWHEDCKHFGLPPCVTEQMSWMGLTCGQDTPGALPVLMLEVEPQPMAFVDGEWRPVDGVIRGSR